MPTGTSGVNAGAAYKEVDKVAREHAEPNFEKVMSMRVNA